MSNLLTIKNLNAWYDQAQILHQVNMHVKEGEIVSIIGPNGAGKSTCLKAIANLVPRKEGNIFLQGKEISTIASHHLVKEGISFVPKGRSVFPSLRVEENLELLGFILKKDLDKRIKEVYSQFPVLADKKKQKAGLLSGGEQQMLALGRALLIKPKLLLMDEPTLGLSPKMKKLIFEKVKEINKETRLAILMVEQNARMALKLSDRAYVLELGRNRLEGTGEELLHDKEVEHLYLGGH